jgi:hypothetical protein
MSQGYAELFSQLHSPERGRQYNCFSHRRNLDRVSTRKFNFRVITQPGSKAALTAPKSNFRFTPESGLRSDIAPCPKSAISGLMQRSNA